MSHGDRVDALPPGFRVVAASDNAPFAAIADDTRAASTACSSIPRSRTRRRARRSSRTSRTASPAAAATGRWPRSAPRRSRASARRSARAASSAASRAASTRRSRRCCCTRRIGDQLTCIFVDNGLLRQGEAEQVVTTVPRPLQHPAWSIATRGDAVPRRLARRHRPRAEAQDHRRDVHRRLRGRSDARSAAPSSSRRARSIPTSSRASRSPAARASRSRPTTTSAACPSG